MGLLRLLMRFFTAPPADPARPAEPGPWDRPAQRGPCESPAPPPAFPRAPLPPSRPPVQHLVGPAYVVDGDTIVIGRQSIRLAGIDAPELDQTYGQNARRAMMALCKGQVIRAEIRDGETSYERLVARCFLPDGRDIAAELVKQGLALDWGKHSGGAYRGLETPDARRKLWRSAAKHRGKLIPK